MKKIPTIFKRNPDNMKEVLPKVTPGCEWVFAGEGVPTRKYDGTCVKIDDGKYFKRREVKKGKQPPKKFIEEQFDENTGKRFGWVPVDRESKEDQYHMEAFHDQLPNGTFELCGPKINGNPERMHKHILIRHYTADAYPDIPRNYEAIKECLKDKDIEGLVFHHPDGRMAKIKKRDFGLKRTG